MRVLFTTHPAAGHFHPQVPLAEALVAAGHEVAFACSPAYRDTIAATGFRCFPCGLDWLEAEAERTFPQLLDIPPGRERSSWFAANIFADATARALAAAVLALAASWPPDVIVRDAIEFGGWAAAERLGIPHAVGGIGWLLPAARRRQMLGASLAALRREHGLPDDPDLATLDRYLGLVFQPPWFLGPDDEVSPTTHFLRPAIFDQSGDEALPDWVAVLPARPTVYATLGTISNRTPGLFAAILAALRDEPVNLVLTVGRNQDPADFGPQPAHVHIARYVPQTLLLPRCDLVITHGGFNTTMAALDQGLPVVAIPLGADQFNNAARCASLGVGRVVELDERTPEAIRATVRDVLADPAYRRRASERREELRAMPGLDHGVALLERLARERAPIGAG